ncbi:MAG: rod shape-determining protein MreD [Bacteroidales bacterium]
MIKVVIISVIQFLVLLFCQIFLLNNIYFLGFVNPMLYIWFVLMLPFATPKWLVLVTSFVLGVSVDIFSSDIGINAFVSVFIGFIRPTILVTFFDGLDNVSYLRPSASSMGFKNFFLYVLILVLTHHFLYFTIAVFSFKEILQIMGRTLLSTVITTALILFLDMIFLKKNK